MAEYIELSQATTLFGDVDARFDTVEGKIPSNASSGNKMVTASDIATKADLVDGKVPAAQLPSFVDDVLEYASTSAFPATGESGKIYVALDTNKTYRWGGSDYVEISESLALGETSSTAYEGSKGKANADAITAINGKIPSTATSSNKMITDTELKNGTASSDILLRRTVGHTNKNLLPIPSSVVTTTDNGITYTITRNDEGEVTQITLNGTATADSTLELNSSVDISGQSGGSVTIYGFENASQHSSEYKFLFEKISGSTYHAYIKVFSGVTVSDVVCKPMVRDKYTSTTFEPYRKNTIDEDIADIKGLIPEDASILNKLATASDVEVDQTYDATSDKAQSGTAVASAIEPFTTAQINTLKGLI